MNLFLVAHNIFVRRWQIFWNSLWGLWTASVGEFKCGRSWWWMIRVRVLSTPLIFSWMFRGVWIIMNCDENICHQVVCLSENSWSWFFSIVSTTVFTNVDNDWKNNPDQQNDSNYFKNFSVIPTFSYKREVKWFKFFNSSSINSFKTWPILKTFN